MDFLFVVGIAQAFFFALLLSRKRHRSVADNVLMVWLVFIGLHLLGFYLDYSGVGQRYPHLMGFDRFMPAAEGPFLWVYCTALLSGASKFKPVWLLHFVPFVVLNLSIIDFYLLPAEEKRFYLEHVLWTAPPWQAVAGSYLNLFSGPVYVVVVLFKLHQFRKGLRDYFSSTEKVNMLWLQRLAYGLGAIWAVVIASNIYCKVYDCDLTHHNDYYIFVAVSLYVLYLGYYGMRYENIFVNFNTTAAGSPEKKSDGKYQRTGLKAADQEALLGQVIALMEKEKVYLEQNLTLDDLARQLSSPRHYLSQAIGSRPGQTFYSLVNGYRVSEAREKLASPAYDHLSLLGIGLDCGFNSKASFNRVFKEFTGLTPGQFKDQREKTLTKKSQPDK